MREKALQAAIVTLLRAHRVHVSVLGTVRRRNADGSRPHYGTQQTPGLPDLFLMWPGQGEGGLPHCCWVELKSPTGRLSEAQMAWHVMARRCGLDVLTWRSIDIALLWLVQQGLRKAA